MKYPALPEGHIFLYEGMKTRPDDKFYNGRTWSLLGTGATTLPVLPYEQVCRPVTKFKCPLTED